VKSIIGWLVYCSEGHGADDNYYKTKKEADVWCLSHCSGCKSVKVEIRPLKKKPSRRTGKP